MKLKQPEQKRSKTADAIGVPEQEPTGPFFDIERDMTEKDWETFEDQIKRARTQQRWHDFMQLMGTYTLVHPEDARAINLTKTERDLVSAYQADLMNQADPDRVGAFMENLKLMQSAHPQPIEPGSSADIDVEELSEVRKRSIARLMNYLKDIATPGYLEILTSLRIAYPELAKAYSSREDVWELAKLRVQELIAGGSDQGAFETISHVKLNYPEKDISSLLTKELRQAMKQRLTELKSSIERNPQEFINASQLARLLRHLMVITAEKAIITDDGELQITPARKNLAPDQPLPQRPQV